MAIDTKEDKKAPVTSNNNSSIPSAGASKSSAPNKPQAPTPGASKPTPQMATKKGANNNTKPSQLVIHSQPASNSTTAPPNILPKPALSPVKVIQPGSGNNAVLQPQPASVVLQPQMRSPLKNIAPLPASNISSLVVNNTSLSPPLGQHSITGPGIVTLLPLPQLGAISPLQSTVNTPGQMSPVSPRTGSVVTSEPQLQAAFHLLQQLSPTSKQRFVSTSPVGHISPPMLSPTISPVAFSAVNTSARVLPPKPSEPLNNNVTMNINNNVMLSPGTTNNKRKADSLPDESPPKKQKS